MKTLLNIIIALLLIVLVSKFSCTNTDYEDQTEPAEHRAAIHAKKNKKVVEAFVTSVKVLHVTVFDDGTDHSILAEELCSQVRMMDVKRIKVIKYGTSKNVKKDTPYGVLLADQWCR